MRSVGSELVTLLTELNGGASIGSTLGYQLLNLAKANGGTTPAVDGAAGDPTAEANATGLPHVTLVHVAQKLRPILTPHLQDVCQCLLERHTSAPHRDLPVVGVHRNHVIP